MDLSEGVTTYNFRLQTIPIPLIPINSKFQLIPSTTPVIPINSRNSK